MQGDRGEVSTDEGKKKASCDDDKRFVIILNCIHIFDLCMHILP